MDSDPMEIEKIESLPVVAGTKCSNSNDRRLTKKIFSDRATDPFERMLKRMQTRKLLAGEMQPEPEPKPELTSEEAEKRRKRLIEEYKSPPALAKIVGEDELDVFKIADLVESYAREKKLVKNKMVECDAVLSDALGGINTPITFASLATRALEQLPGWTYKKPTKKYPLSPAFQRFLGTGEKEMDVAEARFRVNDHIRVNKLFDKERRIVRCDEKLQKLFKCEIVSSENLYQRINIHLLGCKFIRSAGDSRKELPKEKLMATLGYD